MPCSITLVSEYSPARMRGKAVTAMFGGFPLGSVLVALVAMAVVPAFGWRMLVLLGFLPILLLPVLAVYVPESIRYLVGKGRYDDAVKEIRKVEKAAGVAPIEWTPEMLRQTAQAGASVKELFRNNLATMTILLWLAYFFNLLAVYGLVVWIPTLMVKAGHSVVRGYSFGLAQSIGCVLSGFLLGVIMDKVGRKTVLVTTYIAAGIAVWLFGSVSSNLWLYIFGAICGLVPGVMTAMQVVAGETYPTNIRSTGVGYTGAAGRWGSVLAPVMGGMLQMYGLTSQQFFIAFAVPCFVCAFLVLLFRVNIKDEALEQVTAKLAKATLTRAVGEVG